jgi:hypothetical protein
MSTTHGNSLLQVEPATTINYISDAFADVDVLCPTEDPGADNTSGYVAR